MLLSDSLFCLQYFFKHQIIAHKFGKLGGLGLGGYGGGIGGIGGIGGGFGGGKIAL